MGKISVDAEAVAPRELHAVPTGMPSSHQPGAGLSAGPPLSAGVPLLGQSASNGLSRRLALGFAWSLVGTVLSRGLYVAASVGAARLLGRTGYGELGMIQSTVGMFGVFAGLGLGLAATKYIGEWREKDPERAGRVGALSFVFAVISGALGTIALTLFAPWLASKSLAAPSLAVPLAIGSGLLFFGVVNGVQTGMLAGMEAFKPIAKVNFWAGIGSFPLIVGGTWYWGLRGAVVGLVASLALNCVLNNRVLRHEASRARIPLGFSGFWEERAVLWRFSLPALLADTIYGPAAWACNAMLANRSGGYADLGLFNAADQWKNIVLFLPGVFSRVLLPVLSSYSGNSSEETGRFTTSLDAGFSAAVASALPLITIFAFGAEFIAQAYGKDFNGMARPLAGTLCAAGIVALGTPAGLAIQAMGKMWLGMLINLVWACLLVGSFHFFIRYGAWGLASAYALSFLSVTLITLWYVCTVGYYPWRLGVRTYLACGTLALFAFTPVFLPSKLRLEFCPVALLCALIGTLLLIPRQTRNVLRVRVPALFGELVKK